MIRRIAGLGSTAAAVWRQGTSHIPAPWAAANDRSGERSSNFLHNLLQPKDAGR